MKTYTISTSGIKNFSTYLSVTSEDGSMDYKIEKVTNPNPLSTLYDINGRVVLNQAEAQKANNLPFMNQDGDLAYAFQVNPRDPYPNKGSMYDGKGNLVCKLNPVDNAITSILASDGSEIGKIKVKGGLSGGVYKKPEDQVTFDEAKIPTEAALLLALILL